MKITTKHQNYRLDNYLAEKLEISRSQAQKLINGGAVLINNKIPSKHQFLKINDLVKVKKVTRITKKEPATASSQKSETIAKPKIIFENPDYLIINKPAGLLVHATNRQEKNTLVDWLLKHYPELKKVGSDDPRRPAIVHRLDKDVSGLMIVPKNLKAFDHFKKQFQKRTIQKQYLALAYGKFEGDHYEINFPITRSKSGKYVALPKKSLDGKIAITQIDVEKRFTNYTLLRVFPKTGRTNQIRIHLSAFNHPLVGDNLYFNKQFSNIKIELNRIFLHAEKITFTDLDNQIKNYSATIPTTLKKIIDNLK